MTTILRNARLFDGTGKDPVADSVIQIEDKRIRSISIETANDDFPEGATVIDVGGKTVMPALTDSHAGFMRPVPADVPNPYTTNAKFVAAATLRAVINGWKCIKAGVTTVRVDTSPHEAIYALKEAYASGLHEGPRLIVPGRGITMTGGHGWYECHEADGPEGVRKAARIELKEGADWIKLMATAGSGGAYANESPEQAQFSVEEMRTAAEEAHKKGKFVMVHVSCAEGARNCIEAGADSIEHGLFLEEDIVRDMKEKDIFLVPTLWLYRRLVEIGERGEIPEWKYKRAMGVVPKHTRSFHLALEAGVKIAAGTDSGATYTPLGESLFFELETMNAEGMDAKDVLISATRRAAELLRLTNDLGTVEPGKLADILIVDGDPLRNVSDIRKTWMVFKEGKVVFDNSHADMRSDVN